MTAIAFTACTGNKTASPEKAQSFSYEVDKFVARLRQLPKTIKATARRPTIRRWRYI